MKGDSLGKTISSHLRKAISILLAVVIGINILILAYDIRSWTEKITEAFSLQILNVSRVSAQSGDMISLQKNLESVSSPLAQNFGVDVKIQSLSDRRVLVDVPAKRSWIRGWLTSEIKSQLEVNPFGTLETRIRFDHSLIVLGALLRALLSSFLIVTSLLLVKRYVNRLNHQNLDPIDRFSRWLDDVGPEGLIRGTTAFPAEGLQGDLKEGVESLSRKMTDLSTAVAHLESEKKVASVARRVAHDIRSPLSALNVLVSSVDGVSEDQRKIIEQVSSRIEQIASNLLESTGRKVSTSNSKFLDIEKALQEILQEKKIEYHNTSRVALESRVTGDLSRARIGFDAEDFKRIVSNLINNSFEAIEGEGSIVVDAWATESKAYVRVQDTGRGIPETLLAKLKREQVTSKINGMGIGIFSANEILERHGHSLEIHSKENLGTQVSLNFNL